MQGNIQRERKQLPILRRLLVAGLLVSLTALAVATEQVAATPEERQHRYDAGREPVVDLARIEATLPAEALHDLHARGEISGDARRTVERDLDLQDARLD